MHSLLKRQIKKIFGENPSFSMEMQNFIDAVDNSYAEFDMDRSLLERSLELSSQELVQANSDMNNILTAIPDLMFRIDRSGKILDCKASIRNEFFINPYELYGKKIQDIPNKALSEKFRNAIEEVNKSNSIVHIEYVHNDAGNRKWYEMRLIPLVNGQLFSIIRNITKRKQTEEALKESEERYRTFIDSLPNLVFLKNDKLEYINVNEAFVEFLGRKNKEEVLGRTNEELLSENIAKDWRKSDFEVLQNLEIGVYEHHIGELYLEAIKFPVRLSENKIGIGGFVSDITTRKRAQEDILKSKEHAEEMNRLKSNFLSNLSHELRTPLVGLLGFSDLLTLKLEDEYKRYAELIYKSGQRLLNTLNSTLSYTKIETEKLKIEPKPISIISIIKEEIRLCLPIAVQKGLYIEEEFLCKDRLIISDERMIRESISHILNNALKFTFDGGVKVTLKIVDDLYLISIIDTGVGIPKDKYELIFEEFRQVSEGQSRNFEGTGLGLTIAKKYVEFLGGKIELTSEVGIGSEFTLAIPITTVLENTHADSPESNSPIIKEDKISIPEDLTVLMVEDDDMNSIAIKNMLNSYCSLIDVKNASAAIDEVKKNKIDVILMDINLRHGMSGVEATREIRKIDGYQTIPIVAMTAYVMPDDREEFLSSGCSHFLAKPFSRKELLSLLGTCKRRMIKR